MPKNDALNDLILKLRNGDLHAFNKIYYQYFRRVLGFVGKYIRDKDAAMEVAQDVFVKIWNNRTKVNPAENFEAFLFRITYNESIDAIRKNIRTKQSLVYCESFESSEFDVSESTTIDYAEFKQQIDTLIEELTPRQREIFLLSRESGLTHEQIAEKIGVSKNTVKNHIVNTLSFFKTHINKAAYAFVMFF
ncbi:MAG: RNA polymerase sigma factor [Mangrovibacterium sp.]